MGLTYASITLSNAKLPELKSIEAKALVDTGSLLLCIPPHIATQLQLEELEKRGVTTADGKEHKCSYVGPIEIKFDNRICFAGALILGDEVLLGAVPMEDMDLVINPATQRLTVNPENPNMPVVKVK